MQKIIYIIQGIIAQISAQIVVSARNPIHRIASQVVVFMIGAFIFMIQDYYFQGQTYIIVYVGAIAILFLFVIMMVQIPIQSTETQEIYIPKQLITSINIKKNQKEEINKTIKRIKIIEGVEGIKEEINKNYLTIIFTPIIEEENKRIKEIMIIEEGIKEEKENNIQKIGGIGIIIGIIIMIIGKINGGKQERTGEIYTYIYPEWSIEYKTMTDIETLGYIGYIGYPIAQIQIAITLWAVQIGIISICTTKNK